MKLFGFVVGFFSKQNLAEKLTDVEEAAKRDAQLAVGTYVQTFQAEVSRLLQESSQQMLTYETSENGDQIVDAVIVPPIPEQEFDYSGMSWTELRAEAREQGIQFTPKTTRVELTAQLR